MISAVSHLKINAKDKKSFLKQVEDVMNLANWKKHITGRKIFIKLNCLSDQVVPGQCTSPWVFEGVLRVLQKKKGIELYAGDADVATQHQLEKCARNWGFRKISEEYGVTFLNLSQEKTVKADFKGKIFHNIDIPKILLDVDSIITLPVLKTHNVTTMTFSLKNQWGCLPRVRHQYHLVAGRAIPEINKILTPSFVVGDASICMEGDGPRVGEPKIVNSVLASSDLVAIDSAGAKIIGINPKKVTHIIEAEKIGLGRMKYKLIGDKIKSHNFKPGIAKNHPIVKWELRLRKIRGLEYLLFRTPVFKIPAFIASRYNSIWWYRLKGINLSRNIINENKLYKQEFGELIK